jgi:hypothetical protein
VITTETVRGEAVNQHGQGVSVWTASKGTSHWTHPVFLTGCHGHNAVAGLLLVCNGYPSFEWTFLLMSSTAGHLDTPLLCACLWGCESLCTGYRRVLLCYVRA